MRKNIYVTKEDKIIYLNGKHIIIYDKMTTNQDFLLKDFEDTDVSSMNYFEKNAKNIKIAVGLFPSKDFPL